MSDPAKSEMHIIRLLPNMLTLASLCAGLTAIRFAIEGNFETAVRLILLAAVLDGLDGRLARLLKTQSAIGAELDSLADFVNFGVAPVLLVYLWGLQDMRSEAWIAILIFAVCCVTRLARFNVDARAGEPEAPKNFFTGVPSPAGAVLVMLPMYIYFLTGMRPGGVVMDIAVCVWVVAVGLLMISRIPTYSAKKATIARKRVRYFMIGFVVLLAALITYTWLTLVVCSVIYLATIPFARRAAMRTDWPG